MWSAEVPTAVTAGEHAIRWMRELDKEDLELLHELGAMSPSLLLERLRELHALAYKLGVEERAFHFRTLFLTRQSFNLLPIHLLYCSLFRAAHDARQASQRSRAVDGFDASRKQAAALELSRFISHRPSLISCTDFRRFSACLTLSISQLLNILHHQYTFIHVLTLLISFLTDLASDSAYFIVRALISRSQMRRNFSLYSH